MPWRLIEYGIKVMSRFVTSDLSDFMVVETIQNTLYSYSVIFRYHSVILRYDSVILPYDSLILR